MNVLVLIRLRFTRNSHSVEVPLLFFLWDNLIPSQQLGEREIMTVTWNVREVTRNGVVTFEALKTWNLGRTHRKGKLVSERPEKVMVMEELPNRRAEFICAGITALLVVQKMPSHSSSMQTRKAREPFRPSAGT